MNNETLITTAFEPSYTSVKFKPNTAYKLYNYSTTLLFYSSNFLQQQIKDFWEILMINSQSTWKTDFH